MSYARAVVLKLPISDEALLAPFVEACLRDKVEIVAAVGEGSERVEWLIDELIVGDASDGSRFMLTTSHPDEPLSEVVEFAQLYAHESFVQVVSL